jgi:hypothetical protein
MRGRTLLNTLEIVLLSLLAGLLTAFLIASTIYLAWMLNSVRRFLSAAQSAITSSSSAAASDISLLRTQIDAILNTHRQEMSAVISRINGDKLIEAANVILRSAQRIETAAISFGQLATSMLSGELEPEFQRIRNSGGLGAESYAPNPTGERFVSQSRTASQDRDELLGEGVEDRPGE